MEATDLDVFLAAEHNDTSKLSGLLAAGGNPNSSDDGNPALIATVHNGHAYSMQILVPHGADVNIRAVNGYTPLLSAATKNVDMVLFLVRNGANINAQDISGITALMIACENADVDIARILLKYHADVDMRDNSGQTALMKAASMQYDTTPCKAIDAAGVLLRHGANPNVTDNRGQTALTLARANNHPDMVALLKKAGAKE